MSLIIFYNKLKIITYFIKPFINDYFNPLIFNKSSFKSGKPDECN